LSGGLPRGIVVLAASLMRDFMEKLCIGGELVALTVIRIIVTSAFCQDLTNYKGRFSKKD
jgi:hypothetical protein